MEEQYALAPNHNHRLGDTSHEAMAWGVSVRIGLIFSQPRRRLAAMADSNEVRGRQSTAMVKDANQSYHFCGRWIVIVVDDRVYRLSRKSKREEKQD